MWTVKLPSSPQLVTSHTGSSTGGTRERERGGGSLLQGLTIRERGGREGGREGEKGGGAGLGLERGGRACRLLLQGQGC